MIPYHQALNNILSTVTCVEEEIVDLNNAIERVCSQTIVSAESLPSFASSSMDGFAVRAEVTQHCSKDSPLCLPVIDTIAAGDKPITNVNLSHALAYEIMTGAPVPDEYNSVIPIEYIHFSNETNDTLKQIIIHEPSLPGRNIRYSGEDFQIGDVIISQGSIVEAAHILALASLGISAISVYRQLKIVILSTGNELVPIETTSLAIGQVRHSNGIYLQNALMHSGIKADFLGSFPDNSNILELKITELLHSDSPPDIIITTGAVSAGKWDFIPALAQKLKAKILFHKVAIRPGKPILAAKLTDQTYLVGLPGNPISCAVGLRFFIRPLLRKMRNMNSEMPQVAKLKDTIGKTPGLQQFCKANCNVDSLGQLTVTISPKDQESFKIKPLLNANCWAVLLDSRGEYQAGELIDVYPL